jgi:hypothetical protein
MNSLLPIVARVASVQQGSNMDRQLVLMCPICEKKTWKNWWVERWQMIVIHEDGTQCTRGEKTDVPTGIFDGLYKEDI